MDIKQLAQEIFPQTVEWRRYLHRNPETSWSERDTSAWLAARLRDAGLEPRPAAGLGWLVDIAGGRPGPRIALRADMDALAIEEKTGLPFASARPGAMHACGHDAHMAMLLAAATILARHRAQIAGAVRLFWQPAEESPPPGAPALADTGAEAMIRDGALRDVQAVFGVHVMPFAPAGVIGLRAGPLMAASQSFDIDVFGRGGHAGMAAGTVDAAAAAAQLVSGLRAAVVDGLDPAEPLVVHIGQVVAGASRTAVAASARLLGTLRFTNPAMRDLLLEKISRAAHAIVEPLGATATVEFEKHCNPPVINHAATTEALRPIAIETAGGENVFEPPAVMGSEDFSFYQQETPGVFVFLGVGGDSGLHSPTFNLDETAMRVGVEYWLRLGVAPGRVVV
jgi:amidohydrolase